MKSTLVAYILWLFSGMGVLGFHRFYLGKPVSGLVWFFTGGLGGIGGIIDGFLIPGMVHAWNNRHKPVEVNNTITFQQGDSK